MTDTISLVLPSPPQELSPNARLSWQEKRQYTRDYRNDCARLAKSVRIGWQTKGMSFPLPPPVTALYTFVLPDKREQDYVNLYGAFKAAEDGLRDGGLIASDSAWKLRVGLEVELGARAKVRVVLQGAET